MTDFAFVISGLTPVEKCELVDQALASLNAELGDPHAPDLASELLEEGATEALDDFHRACDAWDSFADRVKGLRDA